MWYYFGKENTVGKKLRNISYIFLSITANKLSLKQTGRHSEVLLKQEAGEHVKPYKDAETLRSLTKTNTTQEKITIGRNGLSNRILEIASGFTKAYGITLEDIIIRQIRYSDDLTESVYTRMIKERNQIAEAYRSYGRGQLAQWQGKTENDRKNIISQAYRESEKIKGEADAEASRIYAEAYRKDPEFFAYWRSLESYKEKLNKIDWVMSTDIKYFDHL